MKRLADSVHILLPPVRLFREDIDDLILTAGDRKKVELVHRGYSFDSLDELADRMPGSRVHELDVTVSGSGQDIGRLSIHFEQGGVRLYGGPEDAATASLIAENLRKCVPWYSWRPIGHWWAGVHGVLGLILAWSCAIALTQMSGVPTWLAITLGAIAGGALGWSAMSDHVWLGATVLHLNPRARQLTFWQRNRDSIVVGIITSIVSLVLGFLIGRASP